MTRGMSALLTPPEIAVDETKTQNRNLTDICWKATHGNKLAEYSLDIWTPHFDPAACHSRTKIKMTKLTVAIVAGSREPPSSTRGKGVARPGLPLPRAEGMVINRNLRRIGRNEKT